MKGDFQSVPDTCPHCGTVVEKTVVGESVCTSCKAVVHP